ncbi:MULTISPECIES: TetR/AcrR family transcriptional regulator [Streptomyces]|uniref:Helix-turn-helix domain-containing protein n=2 Tax=Streptomyces TaxID=1883 RepID=A0ABD5ECV0_9ACTN|nr:MULTISPECIES: TetR/AcrR family transcriptional regulator [unclassified Streptomyces]ASY34428.1 TetR family transcriptional regulator [Streptomyces sp. CLI2509]MDT0419022.1 helix-turn-helix domain-containing protein [Streptomyces sp. DSM 41982]
MTDDLSRSGRAGRAEQAGRPEQAEQAGRAEEAGPAGRADARENRERVLAAARDLFRAEGVDVPLREVARRAGVGPATLYRHFATKQALLAEAFAEPLRACREIVAAGAADPDPWRGLCAVIEGLCALHARDRGLTELFLSHLTGPDIAAAARGRAEDLRAMAGLARRAQAAGRLRADFVLDDLLLMLLANKGIHGGPAPVPPAASARFAAYVVRAFAADPGREGELPGAVGVARALGLSGRPSS